MKITNRSLHLDLAFFYLGLIIAFSISGIVLNHRDDIYPMYYAYEVNDVAVRLPKEPEEISREFIENFSRKWDVAYDGHRIRNDNLRVYYERNIILDVDVTTGKGNLEFKRRVPIIGHSMFLHKSTNNIWIWYSDVFGLAILVIAITGMMMPTGKKSFKNRGWKLALAGMAIPIIFLGLSV